MNQKIGSLDHYNSNSDHRKPNLSLLDLVPESLGPRLTTFRGSAAYITRPPGSLTFRAKDHFVSVMLSSVAGMRAARGSDKVQEFDAAVGMLAIAPANEDHYVAWPSPRENVVVAITPESLLELAAHEFDGASAELQSPPYGTIDPKALHIAKLLKAELTQRERPNELYADSLIALFGVHLLRNYVGVRKPSPNTKGGLSPLSARRVRDFLGENFTRQVSVAELASVCGCSPSHFIGAFTRTFGMPPHRYLVNLRLDFAETLLADGKIAIKEIAYLSGFSSQGHMAATMKQYRGKTPAQVRFGR
ncbi:helix-turn-helix domain-containing protein [Mesorhizobium captivum]|uniref:helix-turn-helix domain-containing protein n=1 Tax=Mesorhizobium captivum TaxID=3072319 RepID=UPI002A240912|nr:AraC family transcriptional regulator [Mesorhizobium sp. VK23E]MDX8512105.1 AraC family transcriptional regulator [Mesorhizobium sp. VK23E]